MLPNRYYIIKIVNACIGIIPITCTYTYFLVKNKNVKTQITKKNIVFKTCLEIHVYMCNIFVLYNVS